VFLSPFSRNLLRAPWLTVLTISVTFNATMLWSLLCCILLFIYLLVVLGFELRALPGRCSIIWAMPPALFRFSHFHIGFFAQGSLGPWSNICLWFGWGYRHAPLCSACLLGWDLANFLPGLVSNCDLPDLCNLSIWDYKHVSLH
jgi:hypothetical protein